MKLLDGRPSRAVARRFSEAVQVPSCPAIDPDQTRSRLSGRSWHEMQLRQLTTARWRRDSEFAALRNLCGWVAVSFKAPRRKPCRELVSQRYDLDKKIKTVRTDQSNILITVSSRTKKQKSSRKINVGLKPCTRPVMIDHDGVGSRLVAARRVRSERRYA